MIKEKLQYNSPQKNSSTKQSQPYEWDGGSGLSRLPLWHKWNLGSVLATVIKALTRSKQKNQRSLLQCAAQVCKIRYVIIWPPVVDLKLVALNLVLP